MTCFWDGIISALKISDFQQIGLQQRPNAAQFCSALKRHNVRSTRVKWNGEILTCQFMDECYEARRNLNVSAIRNGYDCSTCDPFLILCVELFQVNIRHDYLGIRMNYEFTGNRVATVEPNRTLHFGSNRGHFYKK